MSFLASALRSHAGLTVLFVFSAASGALAYDCAGIAMHVSGGSTGMSMPAANMPAAEAPFLAENDAAMRKMMADMEVKPSGDIDKDFVAMMVPHHQGAIDMAEAVLRYGHNQQVRRLAQEIIVTQQQEIAAMRLAVGEPLPPSTASPTAPSAAAAVPAQANGAPRPMSMQ